MDDPVLTILFWAMLAVSSLALAYPWRVESRVSRVLVHAPLLLPAMFIIYEWRMPVEMNIRIDLLLFVPLFVMVFICYTVRLRQLTGKDRRHEQGS